MTQAVEHEVEKIRAFNRFYTKKIGVMKKIEGDLSLPAARVLFEVAQAAKDGGPPAGVDIAQSLELDPGYVSRLVQQVERKGLLERRKSATDGRRRDLGLTAEGQSIHDELTERTRAELGEMIRPLSVDQRRRLLAAMDTVTRLLQPESPSRAPCVLRRHRSGDLGWVVERHGKLYFEEQRFDERFEALVAKIVADFGHENDPQNERLWIAEQAGRRIGSIMLVRERDDISRLRLFLIEPSARGLGLGRLLIDTCLAFARERGYRAVVLSTVRELAAARYLYEQRGFQLVETGVESPWGPEVHPEEWRLDFDP